MKNLTKYSLGLVIALATAGSAMATTAGRADVNHDNEAGTYTNVKVAKVTHHNIPNDDIGGRAEQVPEPHAFAHVEHGLNSENSRK
ncbi:MAG: hypothetical protein ACI9J2_002324 [Saprospiraceae bacterium]|jgi:hypothetical protein